MTKYIVRFNIDVFMSPCFSITLKIKNKRLSYCNVLNFIPYRLIFTTSVYKPRNPMFYIGSKKCL